MICNVSGSQSCCVLARDCINCTKVRRYKKLHNHHNEVMHLLTEMEELSNHRRWMTGMSSFVKRFVVQAMYRKLVLSWLA